MSEYKWKAAELFPGMWVESKLSGPKLVCLNALNIEVYFEDEPDAEIPFIPIPITRGILERAGFDYEGEVDRYFIQDDAYMIEYGIDYCVLHKWGKLEYEIGSVTHFHELQANIFWDSGREILLTLEK